jgi:hypothetical protein
MRLLPDVDVVILLATALSSKRRPAVLVEIVAAADLIQGFVPYPEKLGDAIRRLSSAGLIDTAGDGFILTPSAQKLMAELPKKADTEEQVILVKAGLAAYKAKGEHTAITPTVEQLGAAVLAHQTARRSSGQNMLMPKPKADRHFKVEGRWRRAPATRGRKG